jgi:hypothetical protein
VGDASQNDPPRANDQHDTNIFSRSSAPARFVGIMAGMTISTQDVAERNDLDEETPPPIHFRRHASAEAENLRRKEDVPTNHFSTQDINRSERSRRTDDCPRRICQPVCPSKTRATPAHSTEKHKSNVRATVSMIGRESSHER